MLDTDLRFVVGRQVDMLVEQGICTVRVAVPGSGEAHGHQAHQECGPLVALLALPVLSHRLEQTCTRVCESAKVHRYIHTHTHTHTQNTHTHKGGISAFVTCDDFSKAGDGKRAQFQASKAGRVCHETNMTIGPR